KLPLLFYIEDNGYSLSVPGDKQTPGGDIAKNLASFTNLYVLDGDGIDPAEASVLLHQAVTHVRSGKGPVLIRLSVPRLCGHSGQDTQAYKSPEVMDEEKSRDPLDKLYHYLVPALFSETSWRELERSVRQEVQAGLEAALKHPDPDPKAVTRYLFAETTPDGSPD